MVEASRRAFLTLPGEPLLLAVSPLEAAVRVAQTSSALGIPIGSLLSNPLCSIPLPLFPDTFPDGRRRWPEVPPTAMWCPLLWLPRRITRRFDSPREAAGLGVESDDLWAVRVALELSATGVYDEETGTWLDVFALIGLDGEDEGDMDRVRRWLDGATDPLLDGFDLTEFMLAAAGFNSSRSMDVAEASLTALRTSAWAYAAQDLLDACHDLLDGRVGVRHDPRLAVATMLTLGQASFAGVEREWQWWAGAQQRLTEIDGSNVVEEIIPAVAVHLRELLANFAPLARMFSTSLRSVRA